MLMLLILMVTLMMTWPLIRLKAQDHFKSKLVKGQASLNLNKLQTCLSRLS